MLLVFFFFRWLGGKSQMVGQLPESETVARCPGVAACMGERQASLHSWGLPGSVFVYISVCEMCWQGWVQSPHPPKPFVCRKDVFELLSGCEIRSHEKQRNLFCPLISCKLWSFFLFSPVQLLLFQNLKHLLKPVTLENLITHRSLLHEGKLVLTGVDSWRQSQAVYVPYVVWVNYDLTSFFFFFLIYQQTQSWQTSSCFCLMNSCWLQRRRETRRYSTSLCCPVLSHLDSSKQV